MKSVVARVFSPKSYSVVLALSYLLPHKRLKRFPSISHHIPPNSLSSLGFLNRTAYSVRYNMPSIVLRFEIIIYEFLDQSNHSH